MESRENMQNATESLSPEIVSTYYSIPIKGQVGRVKRTIFYVQVTGDGTIKEFSCKNVHEMTVVTLEEVCSQIKKFLSSL